MLSTLPSINSLQPPLARHYLTSTSSSPLPTNHAVACHPHLPSFRVTQYSSLSIHSLPSLYRLQVSGNTRRSFASITALPPSAHCLHRPHPLHRLMPPTPYISTLALHQHLSKPTPPLLPPHLAHPSPPSPRSPPHDHPGPPPPILLNTPRTTSAITRAPRHPHLAPTLDLPRLSNALQSSR